MATSDPKSSNVPQELANEPRDESLSTVVPTNNNKNVKKQKRGRRRRSNKSVNVNSKSSNKFSVFVSNIRGAASKSDSLQSIVNNPSIDPEVISLVETNFKQNKKLKLDGYKSFNKNKVSGNMGGISVFVKECDIDKAIKAAEGNDSNEYLVTRHSQFKVPINIITIYGEQESRSKVEDVEKKWNKIMEEIIKIEERNEFIILCGDFNKSVGDIVPGNKPKVSHGGKLVREFLSSEKYVLVNKLPQVKNGPFTRYDTSDPYCLEKKSVLDLVIISKGL